MTLRLTTTQAGELLGVSGPTVIALVHEGLLTDYAHATPDAKRHEYRLDYDQVRALAATYKKNVPRRHKAAPIAAESPRPPAPSGGPLQALQRDVTALHAKMDALLALWS
jgi:hypothetical protein